MDEVALLLELFDELAELVGEAVHGALEAGQQVERHDDGEADAGDCSQQVLFHAGHLLVGGRLSHGASYGSRRRGERLLSAGEIGSGELFDVDLADAGALVGDGEGAANQEGLLGDDVLGPGLDGGGRDVIFRVGQGECLRLGVVEQEFDFKRAFHGGDSFRCVSDGSSVHPARVTAAAAAAGAGASASQLFRP